MRHEHMLQTAHAPASPHSPPRLIDYTCSAVASHPSMPPSHIPFHASHPSMPPSHTPFHSMPHTLPCSPPTHTLQSLHHYTLHPAHPSSHVPTTHLQMLPPTHLQTLPRTTSSTNSHRPKMRPTHKHCSPAPPAGSAPVPICAHSGCLPWVLKYLKPLIWMPS